MRAKMTKARLVAAVFLLALLGGCAMSTKVSTVLPTPLVGGSFALSQGTPTVQALLARLRTAAPAEMTKKGLAEASFVDDGNNQWATISFAKPAYINWVLGVQFIRRPTDVGSQVDALIRTVGKKDGGVPSVDELDPQLSLLRDALRTAAGT